MQSFLLFNCRRQTEAAVRCSSHSLAEVEEDVPSPGALAVNIGLCGFLHMFVIVGEPCLLLDVKHIIDIVACTKEHKIQSTLDMQEYSSFVLSQLVYIYII